jgi:cellobiose phosphorylase
MATMLEQTWDGDWYRRAYFDDGTPLGSAQAQECRIDAISQSWAVLSGVAPPRRAERAMDAVRMQLVRRDAGVIQVLSPPFDQTPLDPGYIKGYLPGVRENGGQYTARRALDRDGDRTSRQR